MFLRLFIRLDARHHWTPFSVWRVCSCRTLVKCCNMHVMFLSLRLQGTVWICPRSPFIKTRAFYRLMLVTAWHCATILSWCKQSMGKNLETAHISSWWLQTFSITWLVSNSASFYCTESNFLKYTFHYGTTVNVQGFSLYALASIYRLHNKILNIVM